MSNFKELYTQDYKGSYTIFQQVLTNHLWLERFLGIMDTIDIETITELVDKVEAIESNYVTENSFENLVRVVPTNLALIDGLLYLQHDGQILSGQEGIKVGGLDVFVLEDVEMVPSGFGEFVTALESGDIASCVVVYENELYYFADNQISSGYLHFTHTGYNAGRQFVKTLTYVKSLQTWTLTSSPVLTEQDVRDLISEDITSALNDDYVIVGEV